MTREEAIKVLEELPYSNGVSYNEEYGLCFGHKWLQAYEMAISALREQDSLEKKTSDSKTIDKKTSDWISVEERLPEDDLPPDTDRVAIKVLTVTKHGTRRFVRELTRQRWWWKGVMQPWSWSKDAIGVTHWMPLPEPPEVEV